MRRPISLTKPPCATPETFAFVHLCRDAEDPTGGAGQQQTGSSKYSVFKRCVGRTSYKNKLLLNTGSCADPASLCSFAGVQGSVLRSLPG